LKKNFLLPKMGILLTLLLSACQQTGAGPRTWIDQPLDDSIFPLQPIILQAHASDNDGVTSIEFYLEDQTLIEAGTGGGRMGQAIYEWHPPGEGEYTIYARATDNAGNTGMPAISSITIGEKFSQLELPVPEPPEIEEQSDEEEEEDPIQVAKESPAGPSVTSSQAINCRAGPDTAFEVEAVLKKDDPAEVIGRISNNSWYLITHPQSFVECWVAASIVTKSGDFGSVSIEKSPQRPQGPPPEPLEEPEPESDTTAPTIASVQVSPGTIYQSGCSSYTQTATISVEVLDIGGISTVQAAWSIGSESGTVVLSHAGGYTYQGTLGPFSAKGTVNIHGSAVDNSSNWTPFITTLVVDCCIC
jgi:hypothetical protein